MMMTFGIDTAMHPQIRLRQRDVDAIIAAFRAVFSPQDKLWIFGSRVVLEARGGDIDLYIQTRLNAADAYNARRQFWHALQEALGDQKIDIVLDLKGGEASPFHLPIYDVAQEEGVRLV